MLLMSSWAFLSGDFMPSSCSTTPAVKPAAAPIAAPHGPPICSPISAPPAVSSRVPPHVPRRDPNRPLVASIIPAAPAAGDFATPCTPPQKLLSEAFHASWFQNVPFKLESAFEAPPLENRP